ncbi:MdtA/MuxA family multidrug efflux RND transporter periplasmic adaptor subunit [Cupriavidus consociatus]|uniref:MdtA/MuxA family multidrug efflux RND transporter periplasmic adaptor subunit n=1 Tax=Cupriavidus consociatus TaxID=2821357 RepID=UPI001AE9C857|nr:MULTISPECIES: MdtA/MuxA family multidrug efflux RND transporter periplasmic adaptor subunit [unclassified Cupriavidus]MBP0625422.1 MdtA/MuxA family multidrug efflux RND transporter periplasmic adaptor subunit [Cupriavidus sp. LEh25]MDK2662163.1 MdtA/MuxA family multidrug efflux RND transporter periplasmic adaptor subunit [Cupriavidus sp. LEh21]
MSNHQQGQPLPPNLPRGPACSHRRTWITAVVILVLAGAAWYSHSHRKPAQEGGIADSPGGAPATPRWPVVVNTVSKRNMDVVLHGLGNVTPTSNVTVRAQVSGPLLKVLFKEGQMVKAGDVLAEIDPRPFQAALDQAAGQLARDQALLQNAKLDQQRYRTLLGQDSISKQQVDTQDALVRQYEGVVKTDQGNVANARLQLGYTRIVAPVSGRIGLRQVDPGNIVNTSDTNGIALITQIQPIAVMYTIPEDNLPAVLKKLNAGEKLPVQAWDRQMRNQLAEGTLLTTDNQIDTTTGTVKLKAIFQNTDGILFPNQFVNIRTCADTMEDAAVIPAAAIQRGEQGTFVYVVSDYSTVKVQRVMLGPSDGARTAVLKGLEPGQRVVVEGGDRLKEGMVVEAVDPTHRAAQMQSSSGASGATSEAATEPGERRRDADTNPNPTTNRPAKPGARVGQRLQ